MDHYLDIKVLPDPEFKESTLINAAFAKLHRALVDVGQGEIGVSFPLAQKTLGAQLRLHGSQAALSRLMAHNWLKGLREYTEVDSIQPIPDTVQYQSVRRVQVKSSAERLRRRSVSKGWLNQDEALAAIPDSKEQRTDLPFVQLKSNSSGQQFRLFIRQEPAPDGAVVGRFNDYGLSDQATLPRF